MKRRYQNFSCLMMSLFSHYNFIKYGFRSDVKRGC